MEGFVYVVNPPVQGKVAFGSGLHREVLPRQGPCVTPFMRRNQGETRDFPGPMEYAPEFYLPKRIPGSNVGHSSFVCKVPRPYKRESIYPPVGTYDAEKPKPVKPAVKPFGISGLRFNYPKIEQCPVPTTYSYHLPQPTYETSASFGGPRKIWPAVAVFCNADNEAECCRCGATPYGDYFHNFEHDLDMCRTCMVKERRALHACQFDVIKRMSMHHELDLFRRARYCGFFHEHNSTEAAMLKFPIEKLRQKIKNENYLYLYSK